jgi:mannose-6-phosphate isomerase-like protein (cupin superfamily)
MLEKVNLAEKLATFDEVFSPRIVGYYNDTKIQVAKSRGEFVWHAHQDTDDLFLVLKGKLTVELRDGAVELEEGELLVVPRGVEHRPVAAEEAHVLLLELRGTPNTGDAAAKPAAELEI